MEEEQELPVEDTLVVLDHKCDKCSYRTSKAKKLNRHIAAKNNLEKPSTSNKAKANAKDQVVQNTLPTGEKDECPFSGKVYTISTP